MYIYIHIIGIQFRYHGIQWYVSKSSLLFGLIIVNSRRDVTGMMLKMYRVIVPKWPQVLAIFRLMNSLYDSARNDDRLVVWNMNLMTFHIFIIPSDKLIFVRGVGLNHQPDQDPTYPASNQGSFCMGSKSGVAVGGGSSHLVSD